MVLLSSQKMQALYRWGHEVCGYQAACLAGCRNRTMGGGEAHFLKKCGGMHLPEGVCCLLDMNAPNPAPL